MLRTTYALSKISQTRSFSSSAVSSEAGKLLSTVGVTLKAGSAFETTETAGASLALSQLLYHANLTRSSKEWSSHYKHLLNLGAVNFRAERCRENYIITTSLIKENGDQAQSLISDIPSASNKYTERQFVSYTEFEKSEPLVLDLVGDAIHELAFRNQPLSRPLHPSATAQSALSLDSLNSFLAASSSNSVNTVASKYARGGETRISGDLSETVVAVAFEGAPVTDIKATIAARILAIAIGNIKEQVGLVRSYPGEGRTSKIGTTFGSKSWIKSAKSWTREYVSSGLIGSTFVIEADVAESADIVKQIVDIYASAEKISAEEFNAAKKLFSSEFLDYYFTNQGRFLVSQHFGADASTILSAVQSVSHQDVVKAAKTATSSKPSIVVAGNLYTVKSL